MSPEDFEYINTAPNPRKVEALKAYYSSRKFHAGLQIDPQIKATVIALNTLGFPTSYSCEGWNPRHPYWSPRRERMDQGAAENPLISISNAPNEPERDLLMIMFGDVSNSCIAGNIHYSRQKLKKLLESAKEANIDTALIEVTDVFYRDTWHLQGKKPPGGYAAESSKEQLEIHAAQLKSMQDFTTYLIQRFQP